MVEHKIKIGIIAGCGLDNAFKECVQNCKKVPMMTAKNDFGYPSSDLYLGQVSGIDVVLMTRHGSGYNVLPTKVNYRANIEAFRLYGCTHVIATTACGALVSTLSKAQLVVPDSFIDKTVHREGTFFDGTSTHYKGICNIPMEPAFDPLTSEIIEEAGDKLNIPIKRGGTVVSIEGPRFSSKAESLMYQSWGGHLINMTTCPEVVLAKEAGLLYAALAMITDNDCLDKQDSVISPNNIIKTFVQNVDKVKKILIKTVELISERNWDQHINDLQELVRTSNITKE